MLVVALCHRLFIAVLATAAADVLYPPGIALDCESGFQGCQADEQLSSQRVELHGLGLLQLEVRLQSDLGQTSPAIPYATAQPEALGKMSPAIAYEASQPEAIKAQAWSEVANRDAGEKSSHEHPKVDASDSDFSISLIEHTAVLHRRSLKNVERLLYSLVSEARMASPIGRLCFLLSLFVAVALCSYLIQIIFLSDDGCGRQPPSSGALKSEFQRAPAQQLLQAPQSTTMAQSPIMATSRSPAAAVVGPTTLPPICPSLLLPHTEARFMIPMEGLTRASGELDIRGTSGRKLLHGAISTTPEGRRCLALASCGCDENPRVTLLAPPADTSAGDGSMGIMKLYGKDGEFYGTLEPAAHGGAVLRCGDELVMSLEIGTSDLRMTASSMDGQLLASAGKNVTQASTRRLESQDTWKVQVKPNFDAVLISACMLGVVLFGK